MSRIAPVPPQLAPPDVRAAYETAMKKFGRLPVPIASPRTIPRSSPLHGIRARIRPGREVDARVTTLAAVKVASLVGCPF